MKTRLAVSDMTCESCKTAIIAAISPLPGVEAVEVDIVGGLVDVLHEPVLKSGRIEAVVEDQGYEVVAREQVT